MPHLVDCEITAQRRVAPGHYRLVLRAPEIVRDAAPGQFCMLEVQPGFHPFLRRPMSIERIHPDGISILYKVVGEGTGLMSTLRAGQKMNIQGPLGKPFPLEPGYERPIMVAGGIGVAPFLGLADILRQDLGTTPEIVLGARTAELLLCQAEFEDMGCTVHIATDDGSAGARALAPAVLEGLNPGPGAVVYACGPMPMLKATHRICAARGLPCFASLEAEMACGDGVCLGCVVRAKVAVESEGMLRVCCDGPVFDTNVIDWEAY